MDCDDTLGKDTTNQLISYLGGRPKQFWKEVQPATLRGNDPPLVWIPKLMALARSHGTPLSKKVLAEAASALEFYPNVPGVFRDLRNWFKGEALRHRLEVGLRFCVISGGLEDLLVASELRRGIDEIYGCTLNFDRHNVAIGPRSIVTFTEKTRYLFTINKGIKKKWARSDPGLVNRYIPASSRQVPLDHMIYLGDGPTDIPCFSIINHGGGHTIGIMGHGKLTKPAIGVRHLRSPEYRPRWGPFSPNYNLDSDLVSTTKDLLLEMLHAMAAG